MRDKRADLVQGGLDASTAARCHRMTDEAKAECEV